jgi:DNA-binding transcriptional ArsR family regulator
MTEIKLPHDHGQKIETLCGHVPPAADFLAVSDLFKQFSDASRLRIFWLLCHGEECVSNISALVEMSSPAVSHHLRQLRTAGLIESRRDGKEVFYRAAATETARLLHRVIEQTMSIVCPLE